MNGKECRILNELGSRNTVRFIGYNTAYKIGKKATAM